MTRENLPTGAAFWYILLNIVTLGVPYFTKIIIMKAITDSQVTKP